MLAVCGGLPSATWYRHGLPAQRANVTGNKRLRKDLRKLNLTKSELNEWDLAQVFLIS